MTVVEMYYPFTGKCEHYFFYKRENAEEVQATSACRIRQVWSIPGTGDANAD